MRLRGIEVLTLPDAFNPAAEQRSARLRNDRTTVGQHNMFIYISFDSKSY
jgi:hypothetical protein